MKPLTLLAVGALCASSAIASDLDLSVESGGSNSIVVGPGDTVNYSVVGELSDANSLGLALFVFDASFDGGDLAAGSTPIAAPISNFATPLGLNNPAGFGGTVVDGDLIQAGGAQNTINNTITPDLSGTVVLGVGLPGSPETLLDGALTAPLNPGTYTLRVENVLANVISLGETGVPFWGVEAAGVGSITDLTIEVVALTADVPSVSISAMDTQTLTLDAGEDNAGRTYFMLGSFTGTDPGFDLAGGLHVPLNIDTYFFLLTENPNLIVLNSFGSLDAGGQATASFSLPPGTPAILAGFTFHHAYVLLSPKDYGSNAVAVEITP